MFNTSEIFRSAHASAKAEMNNKNRAKPLYGSYREAFAEFLAAAYASARVNSPSRAFLVVEPARWGTWAHR